MGAFFAEATNSVTELTGMDECTTNMVVALPTVEMYLKSAFGSNDSFLYRLGFTVNVVFSAARRMCPSGTDRATASAPRLPAAPGRFSTINVCLSFADIWSVIVRATRSIRPPGREATIILTGRWG